MAYSRIAQHSAMLFDARRNDVYARAIRSQVRPDSVVMDLGAGVGIHGLLAAAAGAARVYLVEPQAVVHAALDAARPRGLQEKIIIVQERIEDADLPEQVDLLISVFTGNLLFSEDLLPSLFHARSRYLAPHGAMVPDRAQLWLAPVHAPALHDRHVARWSRPVMGLDYSKERIAAANEILWLRRDEFVGTKALAAGALLADLDFMHTTSADCDGRADCLIETSGECHGLLGWINIRIGDEWVSTAPGAPEVHWAPVMLPIDPPMPLVQGESISLTLHRPAFGDWTWSLSGRAGTRRHSSFLARSDGPRELANAAPGSTPGLRDDGQRTLRALQLMRDGMSNLQVAHTLAAEGGYDRVQMLREVQALAMRYGGRN